MSFRIKCPVPHMRSWDEIVGFRSGTLGEEMVLTYKWATDGFGWNNYLIY